MEDTRTYFLNFCNDKNEHQGCAVVEINRDMMESDLISKYIADFGTNGFPEEDARWMAAITLRCVMEGCMPPNEGSMVAIRVDHMDGFPKLSQYPRHKLLQRDELLALGSVELNAQFDQFGQCHGIEPVKQEETSAWD